MGRGPFLNLDKTNPLAALQKTLIESTHMFS